MSVEQLISLLRYSVNVQYTVEDNTDETEETTKVVTDPVFLQMTDNDLTMFLNLALARVCPTAESLEDLPSGFSYPLMLLAKKELYLKLAVDSAPLYDVTVENNNNLRREQRFQHYMYLVEEAQSEFEDWEKNADIIDPESGIVGVNTYNVLRSKNHYSNRNYELGLRPKVKIKIDTITSDSVSFNWNSFNNDHFGKYKVYIKEGSPVINMYADGVNAENKVTDKAILIKSTMNFRDTFHSVSGLKPDTEYYLAVFSIERNQLFGVAETSFNTLASFIEEEVNKDTIGDDSNE